MKKGTRNRVRRISALLLAFAMLFQQTSVGMASETELATEAVTEAATEAQTEAKATEAATEAKATEAPEAVTEVKATEAPATEAPTEAPVETEMVTEAPTTEAATEAPATEAVTEAPETEAATEAVTEAPETEALTEAPATESETAKPETEAAESKETEAVTEKVTEAGPTLLTAECEGVTVKVEAAEGVLEAGTVLKMEKAAGKEVALEAIQSTLDEDTEINKNKFLAYDITLMLDGEEVQPDGEVTVSFSGVPFEAEKNEELIVAHLQDEEPASPIGTISTFSDISSVAGVEMEKGLSIKTTHFSIYVIGVLQKHANELQSEADKMEDGDAKNQKQSEADKYKEYGKNQGEEGSGQPGVLGEEHYEAQNGFSFKYTDENGQEHIFESPAFDFHVFSDYAEFSVHTNGNIATNHLKAGAAFGTNQKDVSYGGDKGAPDDLLEYNYLGDEITGLEGTIASGRTVLGSDIKWEVSSDSDIKLGNSKYDANNPDDQNNPEYFGATQNGNKFYQAENEKKANEATGERGDRYLDVKKELEKLEDLSKELAKAGKATPSKVTIDPAPDVERGNDTMNTPIKIDVSNGDAINYLNLNAKDLLNGNSKPEINITGVKNKTLIINVNMADLTADEYTQFKGITPTIENYSNGEPIVRENCNVLWNFYVEGKNGPETFKVDGNDVYKSADREENYFDISGGDHFMGTVLAPGANVRYGALNGSVIAQKTLNTTKESHNWRYTGQSASVTVKKVLSAPDESGSKTFFFAVFLDEAGTIRDKNQFVKSVTVTAPNGSGTVTFSDLKANTTYYIYETDADGKRITSESNYAYFVSGGGAVQASYDGSSEVEIKNSKTEEKEGSLTVIKNIAGDLSAGTLTDEQKAKITFRVTGPNFNETFTYADMVNGSKKFDNLKPGTYTVTETNGNLDGYTVQTTFSVTDGVAQVTAGGTASVEVTNTYTQKKGSLTVKKTIAGDLPAETLTEDQKKAITFTVTGPNNYSQKFSYADMENGSKTFNDLVPGEYVVTETNGNLDGYTVTTTFSVTDGKATVVGGGSTTVEVTNTYTQKKGSLTVKKTVAGDLSAADLSDEQKKAITFTVTGPNDYSQKFSYADMKDGSKTFDNLEPGEYVVTETNGNLDGYTVTTTFSVTDGKATVTGGGSTTVEVTNTYTEREKGKLTVTKTFAGDLSAADLDEDQKKAITFTVTGPNGYSREFTYADMKNGKIEFTDLEPGEYIVRETNANVEGYVCVTRYHVGEDVTNRVNIEYEGTAQVDVTNTYKERTGAELVLKGRKELVGAELKPGTFEFTLTAVSDNAKALLPEPSVKNNVANGVFTFDTITFPQDGAGEYKFTVTEKTGTDGTVDYDRTIYTIVVTVEENSDRNGVIIAGVTSDPGVVTGGNGVYELHKAEGKATFSNRKKKGSLKVTKSFEGAQLTPDQKKDITFTVTGPDNYSKTFTYADMKDDVYEIGDLVIGEYTVTESNASVEGYNVTTTYSVGDGKTTVEDGKTAEVTITNTYTKHTDIQLKAKKTYNKSMTEGMFAFTLEELDEQGQPIPGKLWIGKNSAAEKQEGDELATADVIFASIPYTEKGTHTYRISERDPNLPGVEYDETVYEVTVEVKNVDGELVATVSKTTPEVADKVPTFANTYKTTDAKITFKGIKTISGINKTSKVFTFELYQAEDSEFTVAEGAEPLKTAQTTGEITVLQAYSFGELTYDKAGTYYYVVKEKPDATEGFVENTQEYHITVTVTDDGEGHLVASSEDDIEAIDFTNEYKAAKTDITFGGKKTIEGIESTEKVFTFDLYETDKYFRLAANAEPFQHKSTEGEITGSQEYSFDSIEYTKEGTKYYVVKERALDEADGFQENTQEYHITVTVKDNGKGQLQATVSVVTADGSEATESTLDFTNTYKAAETSIEFKGTKSLDGIKSTETVFTFELYEADDENYSIEGKEAVTVTTTGAGDIKFDALKYDAVGKHYYVVKEKALEEGKENGFTIDTTEYHIMVDVTDNQAGQLVATPTVVTADGKSAAADKLDFVNTYAAEGKLSLEAVKSMAKPESELGTFEFVVLDSTGKEVAKVTNDAQGAVSFKDIVTYTVEDAGKEFTYTVKEAAPDERGIYIYDETVYKVTVTVTDNGDGTLKVVPAVTKNGAAADAMTFTNDTTTVKFDKVDEEGKKLAGVELTVKDADGKVIDTWTTDGETLHDITGKLEVGKTYTLEETRVPTGYAKAGKITFTVNEKGQTLVNGEAVETVVMIDKKLHLHVNKVELNGDKEVDDAELTLYDENGNVVDKWTSKTGETHDFGDKLEAGKSYTLKETVTPDGYLVATDITFTVGEDGTVTTTAKKTVDGEGNTVYLMEDGLRPTNYTGSLEVTKSLIDPDGNAFGFDNVTFYVALFADEAKTQRISAVKPITFNGTAGTATFTNLGKGTYYVAETDASGIPLPEGIGEKNNARFEAVFVDGDKVELESDNFAAQLHFNNQFYDKPDGNYYEGELWITKKVMLGAEPMESNDTFYAGVFTDPECTDLFELVVLAMNGSDTSEAQYVKIPKIGEDPSDGMTFYVRETDENGVPIDEATVEYHVSVDLTEVTVTGVDPVKRVTITNTFEEEEETETEIESEEEESESEKAAPRTGDETDYMMYLLLMALSAGAVLIVLMQKRRERNAR